MLGKSLHIDFRVIVMTKHDIPSQNLPVITHTTLAGLYQKYFYPFLLTTDNVHDIVVEPLGPFEYMDI